MLKSCDSVTWVYRATPGSLFGVVPVSGLHACGDFRAPDFPSHRLEAKRSLCHLKQRLTLKRHTTTYVVIVTFHIAPRFPRVHRDEIREIGNWKGRWVRDKIRGRYITSHQMRASMAASTSACRRKPSACTFSLLTYSPSVKCLSDCALGAELPMWLSSVKDEWWSLKGVA